MRAVEVLLDGFGRVHNAVHGAVHGLTESQLQERLDPDANTIAWLAWHLSRVQDDHIADVAGTEQVWSSGGWQQRFDLPFEQDETGYAQQTRDVAAVRATAPLLLDYFDAVHAQTISYVLELRDEDLSRVVDTRWDPPVTLGVRIVSVISDDLQHAGQAAFIRGIVTRRAT
jgi:hypothetical protein